MKKMLFLSFAFIACFCSFASAQIDSLIEPLWEDYIPNRGYHGKVLQTMDSSYIVLGSENVGGYFGFTVTKYLNNGDKKWHFIHNILGWQSANQMFLDKQENIYIPYSSSGDFNAGAHGRFMKLDSEGNQIWDIEFCDSLAGKVLIYSASYLDSSEEFLFFLGKNVVQTDSSYLGYAYVNLDGLIVKTFSKLFLNKQLSSRGEIFQQAPNKIRYQTHITTSFPAFSVYPVSIEFDSLGKMDTMYLGDYNNLTEGYDLKGNRFNLAYDNGAQIYNWCAPTLVDTIQLHKIPINAKSYFIQVLQSGASYLCIENGAGDTIGTTIISYDSLLQEKWTIGLPKGINFRNSIEFMGGFIGSSSYATNQSPYYYEPYIIQVPEDGSGVFGWKMDLTENRNEGYASLIDNENKLIVTGKKTEESPLPSGGFIAKFDPPLYIPATSKLENPSQKQWNVSLSPNPFSSVTNLHIKTPNLPSQKAVLHIHNQAGQYMTTKSIYIESEETIIPLEEMAAWPSGTYWFTVEGDGWFYSVLGFKN